MSASKGKSIIEEWRNPPKYSEDFIRGDQTYEERAVDVVIDNRFQDHPKRFLQSAPPSKTQANNDVNRNNGSEKLIKIKRPQGGGTVRSIPIKDYQASIAHNFGTLRRSTAPQLQFESLVSEPEKSIYISSRKRIPIVTRLHQRTASQITCPAALMEANNARRKSLCRFCNNQPDPRDCRCANVNPNNIAENNQYFTNKIDIADQVSQHGSDIDEYFRRSSRRKISSNDQRASRCAHERSRGNARMTTASDVKDEKMKEKAETLQLTEGHVGQKISAYEQNVRRSPRGSNPRYRSHFEVRGHRTIGVPLVGMHNACGLPVVASWHDHELLDPLRISRGIAGTVGPIYKSPRMVPNARRRTQPKRRAPQPDFTTIHAKDNNDRCNKRPMIKSAAHLDAINGSRRSRRKRRRSSFTTTKMGSLSSKNSFKRTTRSRRKGIKASSLVDTFGRKLIKNGSAKRTALYAKDDGEEAVQVLKNLCLNPLARANPETDMIW